MRASRSLTTLIAAAATAAAALAGQDMLPAAALAVPAALLWVAAAPAVPGDGSSCAHPGYERIQSAVNAAPADATIRVCPGSYAEQLQITTPLSIVGIGQPAVSLPASPVSSTTACDKAASQGTPARPDQDGIVICGPVTVSLTGLTVHAAWAGGTCAGSRYGILVAGGATLKLSDSAVTAAGEQSISTCESGGIGIQAGLAWTTPVEAAHLDLRDSAVRGYQKNGITIDGTGSTADITRAIVTGGGATPEIAQNGIQVSNGARARITASTVTGNECNAVPECGPDSLTETQSAGLLFYGAAAGSEVTDSTIRGNDIGVYYLADQKAGPLSGPAVKVINDSLVSDRYESVLLDQGRSEVDGDTMTGGDVGIRVLQYAGQSLGPDSVARGDQITGMTAAAVQVESDQAASSDHRGSFLIADSEIGSGPVQDDSSNITVTQRHDH